VEMVNIGADLEVPNEAAAVETVWSSGGPMWGLADHRRHKHIPRKRRNGCTPVGYSGPIVLRWGQCGMYPLLGNGRERSIYRTSVAK
jgi:hypothetical protein